MNAIDLINAMCYDSKIAEDGATMTMRPEEDPTEERMDAYCEGYFGTHGGVWRGHREAGAVYFYLYVELEDEAYVRGMLLGQPNAWYVRDDERDIVMLWRIE